MSVANELLLNGVNPLSSKVGWHKDRVLAWRSGKKVAPVTCDVSLTRRCNAACHFCFAATQASDGDEMSKETFFQFLEDAKEIGLKGLSFISDGESTLSPYYVEAVEYAHRLGLKVGAGSNGIRLTKPVLERILPCLSFLRFNFSAGEPKRYAEIMGVPQKMFWVVRQNIVDGMEIVNHGTTCAACGGKGACDNLHGDEYDCPKCSGRGRIPLPCSLNMQMVCHPKDGDQVVPFATLACELKPVYAIIKHCSDDDEGKIGVDYAKYPELEAGMKEAERLGREAGVRIAVKWDKIRTGWNREYTRCRGANFMMQISGNGTVAPCGMKFNSKHQALHLGNLNRTRFRDIFYSERWDEVMRYLDSEHFNPQERCGALCLQHETNNWLDAYVHGRVSLPMTPDPVDVEFI